MSVNKVFVGFLLTGLREFLKISLLCRFRPRSCKGWDSSSSTAWRICSEEPLILVERRDCFLTLMKQLPTERTERLRNQREREGRFISLFFQMFLRLRWVFGSDDVSSGVCNLD